MWRKTVLSAVVIALVLGVRANAQPLCNLGIADHLLNLAAYNKVNADAEIAVGSERVLTCTNSWLRLHDKDGALVLASAKLGNYPDVQNPAFFFPQNAPPSPPEVHVIADPVVYYDRENDRFWVVAVEGRLGSGFFSPTYSHVQIAVSTSSTPANWDALSPLTPTGAWRKYDYCLWQADGSCFNFEGFGHIQTLAVDGDTVYIAFLDDHRPVGDPRTTLMMIDKDALMAGTQPAPQFIHLEDPPINEQTWGHAVAVEYDAWNNTDPVYTVAPSLPSLLNLRQDTILLGAISKNGTTFSYQSVPISGPDLPEWFNTSGSAAAPNSRTVGLIGRDFLHAVFRPDSIVGGRLWTCHHIQESVNGQLVPGDFVRFYEIHTNGWPGIPTASPSIAWHQDIRLPGGETFDPSIAVDAGGVVAISWTQCSPTMWPEFWMGLKRPWDPPGTLGVTRQIATSAGTMNNQYADYCGTDPDPTRPCTFWGHSSLAQSTTLWQSYLGTICIPECDADGYADQDANLIVNPLDMVAYTNRFQANDQRADCNHDGRLDVLDFLCYRDRYNRAAR